MDKYDKDNKSDFADPIVRCDGCQKILTRADIQKHGCCKYCGARKIRNILILSKEEMEDMKQVGVDPHFLALFGEVE